MNLGTPKKKVVVDSDASPFGNYPKVDVRLLHPNTWNPNVMTKEDMKKLKTNIKDTLEATGDGDPKKGKIPPIVVRNHPQHTGEYEIIDGYHRTEVMKQLKFTEVPFCNMGNISTKYAMRLTETLNHLRGTNDPVKYVAYLEDYQRESGESLEEMEEFFPDSAEDMEAIMRAQNVKLDDVKIRGDEDEEEEAEEENNDDKWVEIKFRVAAPQAEIVEAEIARISSVLEGNNMRGRALEFMAVNSADTPLESITGSATDGESKKTKHIKNKLGTKKKRPLVENGEGD